MPGIDAGETLLFSAAANGADGRVLTGDKGELAGLAGQDLDHIDPLLIKKVKLLRPNPGVRRARLHWDPKCRAFKFSCG